MTVQSQPLQVPPPASTTYTGLNNFLTKWVNPGGHPAIAALESAGLLGGLGYAAGPTIASWLMHLPGGASDISDEQRKQIRRRFALVGAGLGGAAWLPLLFKHSITKDASWMPADVPIGTSIGMVMNDPVLTPVDKMQVVYVLNSAAQNAGLGSVSKIRGLVSMQDLISGAVGAGLGATGGYVAGEVLHNIFAMPPEIVGKLSRTGALAGALFGSGIIST